MLQSFKSTNQLLLAATRKPYGLLVGLRYRLHGWQNPVPKPSAQEQKMVPRDADFRQISFTYALIAIAAKLCCNNKGLTREKYVAFREAFPLRGGVCGKIRGLFLLACEDATPVEHYVGQIARLYPSHDELFASLVERLFAIATASGVLAPEDERMLASIAHRLGISASDYTGMRDRHMHGHKPHQLLGLEKRTSPSVIKKRYYELMQHYHPDRFANEALSPELELLLQLKASEINSAYHQLTKRAA